MRGAPGGMEHITQGAYSVGRILTTKGYFNVRACPPSLASAAAAFSSKAGSAGIQQFRLNAHPAQ